MKDPYNILGVKKNATIDQIKKAFKRTSKKTHPDKGGTNEKFIETKEAYEVLANPKKRKLYDETGDIEDNDPKQSIYVEISSMFFAVVNKHEKKIDQFDILSEMLRVFDALKENARQANKELESKIEKSKKLLGRMTKKDGEESIFDGFINGQIIGLEQSLSGNNKKIDEIEEIIIELEIYECSFEIAEEPMSFYERLEEGRKQSQQESPGWSFQ